MYKQARGKVKVEFFIYIHDLIKVCLLLMFSSVVRSSYHCSSTRKLFSLKETIIKRENTLKKITRFSTWMKNTSGNVANKKPKTVPSSKYTVNYKLCDNMAIYPHSVWHLTGRTCPLLVWDAKFWNWSKKRRIAIERSDCNLKIHIYNSERELWH